MSVEDVTTHGLGSQPPRARRPSGPTGAIFGTRVGRFAYSSMAEAWDWDEEIFRILGLEPWSVTPSTAYLLACADPEDGVRVSSVLARAHQGDTGVHIVYRLVVADGSERRILLACGGLLPSDHRSAPWVSGYCVDVTDEFAQHGAEVARHAVAASAANRATIEQAVGVVMVAYGLDAAQAFEMLRWWSQQENVKVRILAARLLDEARRGAATDLAVRRSFDALLHDASRPPHSVE